MGASATLSTLKSALNEMWSVRSAPYVNDFVYFIKNRILAIALLIVFSFICLSSVFLNTIFNSFNNFEILYRYLPAWIFTYTHGVMAGFLIVFWFALLFKILPEVKLPWKEILYGAFLSGFLFFVGKYLIGFYIKKSKMIALYGASGSLVIILLWVYYSSLIILLGASFIKTLVHEKQLLVTHKKHAVWVKKEFWSDEQES